MKIRLLDIDAPVIHDYKRASELALGQRAKMRLLELMNVGPFEVVADGDRDNGSTAFYARAWAAKARPG